MIEERCRFVNINILHQFFHMGAKFGFFSAIFLSSTYTDKNNPCFLWTNRHSQFGAFSHPSFVKTSSNYRSHNSPAEGVTIQIPFKRNFWVIHTGPWFRPFVSWKGYPYVLTFCLWNFEQSGSILHFNLSVSWYGIGCLSFTILYFRNDIHDLGCSHVRRRRALFSENCVGSRIVFNNVTTENNSTFFLLEFWF